MLHFAKDIALITVISIAAVLFSAGLAIGLATALAYNVGRVFAKR